MLSFLNQGDAMAFDPISGLDEIDLRLLREIQDNARTSYTELGRRIGLTPPAVAERVRRLEEAGVILGYRADIDPARVGLPIGAFIRMRAAGNTECLELGERVKDIPEVLECHRVTGDDSYIARVALRSVDHLQDLIDRLMPYAETITSIVLSSVVTRRTIDPELTGAPRPTGVPRSA
jgi:Lrp/AsnC family transcriptional regulator, leucine-responsive regulatory protein